MAHEHPFQHLFETLGRTPHVHAESVNRQAYEVLSDILSVPLEKSGRCILLRAPRAGHGKTHLLSRIQHQMGGSHEFIPLHASFGCRIDAASVIDDTLRCLVKQLPASGGLCVLDLVTRRLFAAALQPLVGSGEVPCQDREGALAALRLRPIETFDFHHPNAVTAHWARENFEVLGQRLSLELAQRVGHPVREIAFWVDALFRFAAAPLDNSNRVRILADTVHEGTGGEMERLEALLGLVSQLMRVVLVADDLEGFSSDETAALRFAAFLGGLRQSVDRLDVILSLNLDIWESAFLPRLSGGLADRLSEVVVELEPLTEMEMAALLDSRVPGLGGKVLERIDIGNAGSHARGLIRAAGMAWLKATAMDAARIAPTPPAAVPISSPVFEPPTRTPGFVAPEPVAIPVPTAGLELAAPDAPARAFTFTSETLAAPSTPAEIEPSWPAPSFSPPPQVELEPENRPFVVSEMAPSANPPVADREPVAFQRPVESPFQASSVESLAGNSTIPEPVVSPFQGAPPESSAGQPTPKSFGFEAAPQSTFQPAAHEPYTFNPPPSQAIFSPDSTPPYEPQPGAPEPEFSQPAFSQDSFQPAPHEPYAFNPPAHAPGDSPFQSSPFVAEPSPQVAFQPVGDSPFQAAPQVFTPVEPAPEPFHPAAVQPTTTAEVTPPPSTADTDRVDDLLRQFRERYGRGSL